MRSKAVTEEAKSNAYQQWLSIFQRHIQPDLTSSTTKTFLALTKKAAVKFSACVMLTSMERTHTYQGSGFFTDAEWWKIFRIWESFPGSTKEIKH